MKKAVAFVDYEHWYISLNKNFGLRPDIKGWFEDLATRVNITEAVFFADFSHKSLSDEIKRIRPYSNKIIDTRSSSMTVKKDFTDFILLDNIYQKALSAQDIETFILFSGDGHFSSVTSFLKNFYSKEVGIYAIDGSFSRQLKETCNWFVVLPNEKSVYGMYYAAIFEYLKDCSAKNTRQLPTLEKTIEAVSASKPIMEKKKVEESLNKLIADRIISQRSTKTNNAQVMGLFVDWDRAAAFQNNL